MQQNSRIANHARNFYNEKYKFEQCRDLLKKKELYMRQFSSILTLT